MIAATAHAVWSALGWADPAGETHAGPLAFFALFVVGECGYRVAVFRGDPSTRKDGEQ